MLKHICSSHISTPYSGVEHLLCPHSGVSLGKPLMTVILNGILCVFFLR